MRAAGYPAAMVRAAVEQQADLGRAQVRGGQGSQGALQQCGLVEGVQADHHGAVPDQRRVQGRWPVQLGKAQGDGRLGRVQGKGGSQHGGGRLVFTRGQAQGRGQVAERLVADCLGQPGPERVGPSPQAQGRVVGEEPGPPRGLQRPGAAEGGQPVARGAAASQVQVQEQVRNLDIGGIDPQQGAQHGLGLQTLVRSVQSQDVLQSVRLGVERGQEVGAHGGLVVPGDARQGAGGLLVEGFQPEPLGQERGKGRNHSGLGAQAGLGRQPGGVTGAKGGIQEELGAVVVQVLENLVAGKPLQLSAHAPGQDREIGGVHLPSLGTARRWAEKVWPRFPVRFVKARGSRLP